MKTPGFSFLLLLVSLLPLASSFLSPNNRLASAGQQTHNFLIAARNNDSKHPSRAGATFTPLLANKDSSVQGSENSVLNMALTAIGSTTSALVAGTFFVILAWQRDALMVSFFIGAISNGILSKILKKILKQERPAELELEDFELKPSDNGMPSSHAMSLGFIGTFTALALPWSRLPILLYVLISLIYRVQTNLHTREQILVGISLGITNGYLWRILCVGDNAWNINVMEWVSTHFLNDNGVLPFYMLAVPALVGAAVVGSLERRIARFLTQTNQKQA
jgi:membrane-associated phospholipid phosphatase